MKSRRTSLPANRSPSPNRTPQFPGAFPKSRASSSALPAICRCTRTTGALPSSRNVVTAHLPAAGDTGEKNPARISRAKSVLSGSISTRIWQAGSPGHSSAGARSRAPMILANGSHWPRCFWCRRSASAAARAWSRSSNRTGSGFAKGWAITAPSTPATEANPSPSFERKPENQMAQATQPGPRKPARLGRSPLPQLPRAVTIASRAPSTALTVPVSFVAGTTIIRQRELTIRLWS